MIDVILKSNATDSSRKASEHATYKMDLVPIWLLKKIPLLNKIRQPSWHGSFFWLLCSFFWGILVVGIIFYFIFSNVGQFTLGNSIIRLASILIPMYFTIFSAQQYLNHRRLYEAYKFKDISLNTMVNLREKLPEHSQEREKVLAKSLDVIFSEPSLKEDIKYDKQLLLEIVRMLRK